MVIVHRLAVGRQSSGEVRAARVPDHVALSDHASLIIAVRGSMTNRVSTYTEASTAVS
jgi:hypothetical protein